MMTNEDIKMFVKKYDIFEHWIEHVAKFPGKITHDEIENFIGKILQLKQEYDEIEIQAFAGGMYGEPRLEVLGLIKKTPEEIHDEILREKRYLEEEEDYVINTLKRFQGEYPRLKITFEDEDNDLERQ